MISNTGTLIAFLFSVATSFWAAEAPTFDRIQPLEAKGETSASTSLGDMDGDGDLDIVLGRGRHWPLDNLILRNDGRGVFTTEKLPSAADRTYSVALADVDGDGSLDLVVSNDRPDRNGIYLNDGRGNYRAAGTFGQSDWPTRYITVADLNGDAHADIIVANRSSNPAKPVPSYVCLNDGKGGFPSEIPLPTESATIIVAADWDGDGNIDLFVPHRDGGQSLIFWNDGTGTFAAAPMPCGPKKANVRAAAAADLDGDGVMDLVIGDALSGLFIYRGQGQRRFDEPFFLGEKSGAPYAIGILDMNSDGTPDLVVGRQRARGSIFFNQSRENQLSFQESKWNDGQGTVYGLALGDLDGDGWPDIVAARSEAPNALWFGQPSAVQKTAPQTVQQVQAQPNIVLILADDLGYGDVSCYNVDSKVPTPNIDRLASEGMKFTDAHSPATVCTPSRYSLMTGQMAFRVPNGGTVFQGVGGPSLITPGKLTLPAMLKQQGYATAAVGKWHVGLTFRDKAGAAIHSGRLEDVQRIDYSRRIEGGPVDVGFDSFFGTACCPTTDWLYAFMDGDRIPVAPAGTIDKSKLPKHPYANDCRAGFIAPNFPMEEVDMVFLEKSRGFIAQHVRESPDQPFFLFHSTQAVHLPSFAAPQFKGKTKAGPHGDFIHQLDHIVGELMVDLEKLGIADNTLVIFSSDNGPEVTSVVHMRSDHDHDGAKPWRGIKRDSWEGGHRVPFIVRWAGKVKGGSTSDQLISLTDVMATLAAVTGFDLTHQAAEDSFNLLPVLQGQSTSPIRPYLLTQAFAGRRTLAIRRGPWKYLDHRGSGGNSYEREDLQPYALADSAPKAPAQLYNLETDPGETTNLFFQQPEIATELKALLQESITQGRSIPSSP